MKVATEFVVEPMRVEHIPAVSAIEQVSFTQPWPQNAYRREILENRMAHYIVVRYLGRELELLATSPHEPPQLNGEGLLDRITRFLRPTQETGGSRNHTFEYGVVGYAGLWLMTDEAHITTIATHPQVRGRGVGELLLLGLIDRALAMGARWMTLEVRASNEVAQNLYRKYTFKEMGVRKRYYSDNGEDAAVMWTDALDSDSFRQALERNQRKLAQRLGAELHLGDHVRTLSDE